MSNEYNGKRNCISFLTTLAIKELLMMNQWLFLPYSYGLSDFKHAKSPIITCESELK